MTTQPEALRLAAVSIFDRSITWQSQATIELRRLSAENAALGAHLSDGIKNLSAVEAQRDALLDALRVFVSCASPVSTEIDERGHRWIAAYLDQALPIAIAAIKAAEGEKT